MALNFSRRELYGGAIEVDLPTDSIDASDLRQVPDHQETFLRPNTLTSVIFEINEYQTAQAVQSNILTSTQEISQSLTADEAAAIHHFKDIIAEPDYIAEPGITTQPAKLAQLSLARFRANYSTAVIITPEIDLSARSTLPVQWQTDPVQKEYQTKSHQLLIRLDEFETDLCVRVNIPMKEFSSVQSEGALTEVATGDQILQKIVESLDIKEFGLFGGGE